VLFSQNEHLPFCLPDEFGEGATGGGAIGFEQPGPSQGYNPGPTQGYNPGPTQGYSPGPTNSQLNLPGGNNTSPQVQTFMCP